MKVRKAVIVAAGWGTRFLPLTKSQPKEMLPLLNKPLLQYSVEEAIACGVELVVIVSAKGKRSIEDYFDRHFELERMLEHSGQTRLLKEVLLPCDMADICYVRQKEQLGLGHAVLAAKRVIGDEPFILFLPDDLFQQKEKVLQNMITISEQYRGSVLAVQAVSEAEVSRYGIIAPEYVAERVHRIVGLTEKPGAGESPSNLAIMGRYVLSAEVFDALENTPPGRNGEIQLTDALQSLLLHHPVYAYEFAGDRYDTGSLPGWIETMVTFAINDPRIGPGLRERITAILSSSSGMKYPLVDGEQDGNVVMMTERR
ncbi:MAG: UTP--glucose-1-phosphate uridylyltransferase GalU [Dehalococcoidales bacterium]|nr:UTP--glucose-1-phosphate uridylyltransferase GalU [Dehalococcoidales bacterium]